MNPKIVKVLVVAAGIAGKIIGSTMVVCGRHLTHSNHRP